MIVDAGFLIAVDRGERAAHTFLAAAVRSRTALHTTEPVVAQVWRNPPEPEPYADPRFLDRMTADELFWPKAVQRRERI